MNHRFAYKVVQKFLTVGSDEERLKLHTHIRINLSKLSRSEYGHKVVVKAIESASELQLSYLIWWLCNEYRPAQARIRENIRSLVQHDYGNSVIQCLYQATESTNRHIQDKLFHVIRDHVMELCNHKFGFRVILCILRHGSCVHRDHIYDEIWTNPRSVILNRYGNLVVVHLPSMYTHLIWFHHPVCKHLFLVIFHDFTSLNINHFGSLTLLSFSSLFVANTTRKLLLTTAAKPFDSIQYREYGGIRIKRIRSECCWNMSLFGHTIATTTCHANDLRNGTNRGGSVLHEFFGKLRDAKVYGIRRPGSVGHVEHETHTILWIHEKWCMRTCCSNPALITNISQQ